MYSHTLASGAKVIKAIMSSGIMIQVEPSVFLDTLNKIATPLVVMSHKKEYFVESYQYMTNYKGLFFWVETKQPLQLPEEIEKIEAAQMFIPRF